MISFENISLNYNNKQVFSNFSLKIDCNDKVLITGKSGNGKTSLFQLLLGFANLDSGQIYLDGKDISSFNSIQRREYFAYVNQDVTLRPGIANDVLLQISQFTHNNFTGKIDKRLAEYFNFDLSLLKKHTQDLSGGERQRLGIMIAIMIDKPIILLDEVTSALDKELKNKVVSYFSELKKTVLTISHDREWQDNTTFRKVEW